MLSGREHGYRVHSSNPRTLSIPNAHPSLLVSTTQKSRGHDRIFFKSIITLLWASRGKKRSLQKRLAEDAKVVMFESVSFRSLTPSLSPFPGNQPCWMAGGMARESISPILVPIPFAFNSSLLVSTTHIPYSNPRVRCSKPLSQLAIPDNSLWQKLCPNSTEMH